MKPNSAAIRASSTTPGSTSTSASSAGCPGLATDRTGDHAATAIDGDRLQPGVDRDRQAGRRPDDEPHGHERRQSAATYTATVTGLSGVDVVVTPSSLTLAPGASATFTVKFTTNSSATFDEYTSGHLTWSDGVHTVRSPLVVKPVALAAPAEVSGNGSAQSYGDHVRLHRPVLDVDARSPRGDADPGHRLGRPDEHVRRRRPRPDGAHINVPGRDDVRALRALRRQHPGGERHRHVRLQAAGRRSASSGSGTSQEIVNLVNPPAGAYKVYVHGWQTLGGGTTSYTLFTWGSRLASAGNMTATGPASRRHRRQRHGQPDVHRPRGRDPLSRRGRLQERRDDGRFHDRLPEDAVGKPTPEEARGPDGPPRCFSSVLIEGLPVITPSWLQTRKR